MSACALGELPPPLSADEAYAVLEPYFEAVRKDYLDAGLRLVKRVKLEIDRDMHDTERHFAGCRDDGLRIVLAPELADVPDRMMLAILAHEFGHATDFLYPGEFVLGHGGPALRRAPESVDDKQWRKWLKAWQHRNDDVVELTADAVAERVMGVAYGYLGPCAIQSFDADRPRPLGLR